MMIALCIGAISMVSCGDESSDDEKDKDGKTAMTPCECKAAGEEMMERVDAGEDVDKLNEEYLSKKEACFKARNDMGKEKFDAAMEECE